ncbi:endonuclease/exonuclease/phosphatase family protein [Nocardioides daphniae]|uniref:Endonuclease/exonuclease/phosphatase domain-containing protein n=1 Tax=Nocardioides daphniae TaxID=402297 RepID=A0A4P7UE71_9ACTN|nr:endonuclease/exonuclease/phosphatase family protein [Nocardioides daphniae]QCC77821.1 hypothetical protein E2C04_12690 [Nocardioides daphniae]GGD27979.1 hypothetical protein GCM10007231_29350 [Nocardioides daphniae]
MRLIVLGVVAGLATVVATVAIPLLTTERAQRVTVSAGVVTSQSTSVEVSTPEPTPEADRDPEADSLPKPKVPVGPPGLKVLDHQFRERGMVRVDKSALQPFVFRVASYNVLGASHTSGKGARKGYAGYAARTPGQVGLIEAHRASVVGLQEFQHPQARQFAGLRGSAYGVYPGLQLGEALSQNSIAWRTDTWSVVETHTIGIPYFGGRPVQMPYVLLRHLGSGRTVWFGNFHNPANIGGNHAGWRAAATRIEADLANRLGADGTPVVMTGDFNDRAEFACPFSARSGMHSPDGAATVNGVCRTPRGMSVDWIFGSGSLQWSDYVQDWSSRDRRLSDHPIIAGTATVPSIHDPSKCRRAKARAGMQIYCPAS